jgi:hypothetical protein
MHVGVPDLALNTQSVQTVASIPWSSTIRFEKLTSSDRLSLWKLGPPLNIRRLLSGRRQSFFNSPFVPHFENTQTTKLKKVFTI